MNIIFIAYIRKILSTLNENSSVECIAKYFESCDDNNLNKYDTEIADEFIHSSSR